MWLRGVLACWAVGLAVVESLSISPPVTKNPHPQSGLNKLWYDAGLYGGYVSNYFKSCDYVSPQVSFLQWSPRCDPGYTFIGLRGLSVASPGPAIFDSTGELVWMEDGFGQATDVKVQTYQGQDFITFWAGSDYRGMGHGNGYYYMLNASYDVVHKVAAVGEWEGDLHEFTITDNGTALITVYAAVKADLTPVGGHEEGWIWDGVVQEIDIATGRLLFEWRASDHYHLDESLKELKGEGKDPKTAYDFFHINSVDKNSAGQYLISSRFMSTVTCIEPDGQICWVVGGRRQSFTDLSDGKATNMRWNHDARWQGNNIFSLFDNEAYDRVSYDADRSRAIVVSVDPHAMTATLLQEYMNPDGILSLSQGSMQILSSGNVFVGWGLDPGYTEFSSEGEVLCNVHFGASAMSTWGWVTSYRVHKNNWVGTPKTWPSIQVATNKRTVYVSWNGATEVTYWRLEGAEMDDADDDDFTPLETVLKDAFEVTLELAGPNNKYLRVVALDAELALLGYSDVINRHTGLAVSDSIFSPEDEDLKPLQFVIIVCGLLTVIGIVSGPVRTFFRDRGRRVRLELKRW